VLASPGGAGAAGLTTPDDSSGAEVDGPAPATATRDPAHSAGLRAITRSSASNSTIASGRDPD
jgi:hypothetical protein